MTLAQDRSRKRPDNTAAEAVWYRGGLRFTCTECGNCCSGAPGYVFVTRWEIEKIAAFIGCAGKGLTRKHLRRVGLRHSLTEDKETGDCCFLEHKEGRRICGIYPVRPLQCRTWPFWSSNLRSPGAWDLTSLSCPGMNEGEYYDFEQIEIRRKAKRVEDLPT
ncbi:MAG: YkgJ family cysteine cluster protein [Phycisphaerae bacterium]|nr:YkgJ family cysteine cluster protein [Phycisphaerae bacterium]